MVQKKDEAIAKYQKTLVEAREQNARKVQELELEIAKLTDKSFEQASQVLQKRKADLDEASKQPSVSETGSTTTAVPGLSREEVRRMLEEKEERFKRHEEAIENWKKKMAEDKAKVEGELLETKQVLKKREEELIRLKGLVTEVEDLRQ
jgi:DNA-binding transcriptional MerR regulator